MSDFEAGIFLLDKPPGPTSFTLVRKVRSLLGLKKVGHAGTLDPFASGLLIMCAGRAATRMIADLMVGEKEYFATLRLGMETSTQDPEGEVIRKRPIGRLDRKEVDNCLSSFLGEQKQIPPAYSALKHKGKPLYYYARKGIKVEKEARCINIKAIERIGEQVTLTEDVADLSIRVVCSKGTYIRTLAADIGEKLGCGAYLSELRRTRSGIFMVENSFPGEEFFKGVSRDRFLQTALSVEEVRNLLH